MTSIRAALVQTTWTGDKESMIKAHEEYAREAAAQGAKVICFQELFYGPYFCQVQDAQYYDYAESIPGPTTERFQALAAELGMVMVLPMYEEEQPGFLYNTAAVVDADGALPRQVPQAPHPARQRLLGEVLLPARQPRLPGLRHRGRQGRRLHLLRPALPRGLARARAQRRPDRVQPRPPPAAGLSNYLWKLEQPAAAVANEYFVGAINRVGIEDLGDDDFYGTSYFVDPEGKFVGEVADAHKPELVVRDLDMDLDHRGPQPLGVLPRPSPRRLRRPGRRP